MKKIIETNRLYLRELTGADIENFYLLNADKDVIKYTGDKAFDSIKDAKSFLENYNPYQEYGYGRWAVIAKSNEEFLGWCGLKFDENTDEIDIGFRFFEHFWNKGFATESAKACIDYGFERLNVKTIVGRAIKENKASIKVLEKIGLQYERDFDFNGREGVIYKIEKNNLSFKSLQK